MPESDKPKIYDAKWEFTFKVRAPGPTVLGTDGRIEVRKIVLIDRGDGRVKVEVSGPLVGRAGLGSTFRTKSYNVSGYANQPAMPDWLVELVRTAGFARTEV